jgi:hypothetical protein
VLMLPEEILVTVPYTAKLDFDIAVKEDEEEKILVEGVVVKLANENGKIVTKLIVDDGLRVCPMCVDRMEGEKYQGSRLLSLWRSGSWKLEVDLLEKTKIKIDKENEKKAKKAFFLKPYGYHNEIYPMK